MSAFENGLVLDIYVPVLLVKPALPLGPTGQPPRAQDFGVCK